MEKRIIKRKDLDPALSEMISELKDIMLSPCVSSASALYGLLFVAASSLELAKNHADELVKI